MSSTIKWLWLVSKQGITPQNTAALLKIYGSIEEIYAAKSYKAAGIKENVAAGLRDKRFDTAEQLYNRICACGARILTYSSRYYPSCLKNIHPIPYVLYVRGQMPLLDDMFAIGIVGTRTNTDYGAEAAAKIASDLARRNVVIVSGLAMGIDSIAMKAAINAGGRTIGVLGCSIDKVYPASNRQLYEAVMKNGLVISEYPPGAPMHRGAFPQRNRIIAGLSRGVLVAEGSRNSGSLITANCALEYNRDVFAVPRDIGAANAHGQLMDGANYLIQSGAKLVTTADDILSEFGYAPSAVKGKSAQRRRETVHTAAPKPKSGTLKPKTGAPSAAPNASMEASITASIKQLNERASNELQRLIIKTIGTGSLFPDELETMLGGDAGSLGTALTMMETMGIIVRTPDGRYGLNY